MKRLLVLFALAVSAFGQTTINGRRLIRGAVVTDSTLNYCADAGANDTYTCSLSPAITGYTAGWCGSFKANTANTGAATINLNSLGAKTIKKAVGGVTSDLADNDIRAGQVVSICYDGTNMQMQSVLGNAATGGGSSTTYGAYSSLPGSCTTGDQYWTSDSVYNFVCTATNTWSSFWRGLKVTRPPTSWTDVNFSGATYDDSLGSIYLGAPASGSDSNRIKVRSVTAPYTVIMMFRSHQATGNFAGCGLVFRQSSDGKIIAFGVQTPHRYHSWYHGSPTGSGSTRGTEITIAGGSEYWLKGEDNNTNRILSFSLDGNTWIEYSSSTRTTDLTADQVGIYCNSVNSQPVAMQVIHYEEQ